MTKKYFPHNIDAIHEVDPSLFSIMSEEWSVEDVLDKFHELPSSVKVLMRVRNQDTLKVKEYVYQRQTAADKRLQAFKDAPEPLEMTIVTNECYVVCRNSKSEPFEF